MMVIDPAHLPARPSARAAIGRLAALTRLSEGDLHALNTSALNVTRYAAHREIVAEGAAGLTPSILLEGWACRVRQYPDGRRQILGFILPGEMIGVCRHHEPLALTSVVAATPVTLFPTPLAETGKGAGLDEAYAVSAALEQSYLFRHIARLGRLNAYERLLDWLLETRDRLALSGLANEAGFRLPLTQEVLADALGLTSVHVNRTLQLMRREKLIELSGGVVRLIDPERLAGLVDYRPAKVTAAPSR